MAECVRIDEWVRSTRSEVMQFFDAAGADGPTRHTLVCRTKIKPVDMYCYLISRFGVPNGVQNALRADDSDNLIHWDFNLKVNGVDLYFVGGSRSVHITVCEKMTDSDWLGLIDAIRNDFQRTAKEMSRTRGMFEKYVVFQNKFVCIADLCAEFHERIIDALAIAEGRLRENEGRESDEYKLSLQQGAQRLNELYGNCLNLRLLMPIMAEAYINMIILMFCKDSIREDSTQYQMLLRENIPVRIARLSETCFGFARSIDATTAAYAQFMRTINRRNFDLHGNVDPVREQIDTVYFDGKRPLFQSGGDNVWRFFQNIERLTKPKDLIIEYEGVHTFLIEIADCLDRGTREFFDQVITDAYPGYELRKRRVTRLFPDRITAAKWGGLLYDDELAI